MSLYLKEAPVSPNAAYTKLPFVVTGSVNTSQPQFQYVMDIFNSGSDEIISRVTQTPNPEGTAVFDPSIVFQGELEYDNYWRAKLEGVPPEGSVKTFILKFAEQYGTSISSSVTVYPYQFVDTIQIFPGVVDPNNGTSFDFITGSTLNNTNVLSNSPIPNLATLENVKFVNSGDYHTITLLQSASVDINLSDDNGFPAGGPYVAGTSELFGTIGVGPQNLIDAGIPLSTAAYIAVGTYPNQYVLATEYSSYHPCRDEYVRFAWINEYGFWDYYNVYNPVRKTSNIQRENVTLSQLDYSSNTAAYDVTRRGEKSFYTDVNDEFEVTTDYLNKDTANWIEELLESPQVYVQRGDGFFPVTITNSQYQHNNETSRNKLFQYTIQFKPANQPFGDWNTSVNYVDPNPFIPLAPPTPTPTPTPGPGPTPTPTPTPQPTPELLPQVVFRANPNYDTDPERYESCLGCYYYGAIRVWTDAPDFNALLTGSYTLYADPYGYVIFNGGNYYWNISESTPTAGDPQNYCNNTRNLRINTTGEIIGQIDCYVNRHYKINSCQDGREFRTSQTTSSLAPTLLSPGDRVYQSDYQGVEAFIISSSFSNSLTGSNDTTSVFLSQDDYTGGVMVGCVTASNSWGYNTGSITATSVDVDTVVVTVGSVSKYVWGEIDYFLKEGTYPSYDPDVDGYDHLETYYGVPSSTNNPPIKAGGQGVFPTRTISGLSPNTDYTIIVRQRIGSVYDYNSPLFFTTTAFSPTPTPTPVPTPCYTYSIENNSSTEGLVYRYTDCSGVLQEDNIVLADSATPSFCAESGSVSRQSGTTAWVLLEEDTTCTVP